MRPEPQINKLIAVSELKTGDTVKLTNGKEAEFIKLKQKNFVGVVDGQSYNIPVNMFSELIKRVDQSAKKDDYMTLKTGDMFYINKSGNALLFCFVGIEKGRIIGINPISKSRTRIEATMYAGKASEFNMN